jgi:hypothetical protein
VFSAGYSIGCTGNFLLRREAGNRPLLFLRSSHSATALLGDSVAWLEFLTFIPLMRSLTFIFIILCIAGTASAQKVHFVPVIDVHSNLEADVRIDHENLRDLFKGRIGKGQFTEHLISENELKADSIEKFLEKLSGVDSDDAVVFYYSGHGAMDNNQDKNQLFTVTDPGTPFRDFLKKKQRQL